MKKNDEPTSEITPGAIGEFEYDYQFVKGRGHRIIWKNPPPKGMELISSFDERVIVDGIGYAGLLLCTRKRDGFQIASFPHDLKLVRK